ncbi:MAG: ASCH domain-containing protein [Candidatus Thiothrix moscowensis]|nr:ASCH domain-containing protein [Candidatus Thiothrix moscowensis]
MNARRKRIQFGEERFIEQILAGCKTVTLCPAEDYDQPWGEYSDGGWLASDEVEVYDATGCLRGVIVVTQVQPITFGEAATTLWREDGYNSYEDFIEDYRQAWSDAQRNTVLIALHFYLLS